MSMYDWGYGEKTDTAAYEASIDDLVKLAQTHGGAFDRYHLNIHEKIHDFKYMARNKQSHLLNDMTKATYMNRVHVPKAGGNVDGEEHGVWQALVNNNITMSDDGTEKTEDDKMDGVFRCVAACLLLGEL